MSEQPLIFSLDIGTRKVAGVVLAKTAEGLSVLAADMLEHPDRAMLDGQVHKVEAVAQVVRRLKASLEKQLGRSLTAASVAAAGRALLTESFEKKIHFPYPTEVTRPEVRALELAAARAAQIALQAKEKNAQLHCVGYSTVHYKLDDQVIEDLAGHQARSMAAKVIATFLPRQVVDALLTVLRQAELEAERLTLEPIAAIEATIPQDLRRMNLALVDIGAGTSDIALTKEGSVFAYDMVTMAGDEITEYLSDHYLLEFHEAEKVKRSLMQGGPVVSYQTLLGQVHEVSKTEMLAILEPVVDRLAEAIGQGILKLNEQPPRAVVMVGGGSATPNLGPALARQLQIEPHRIGVRGPQTITAIQNRPGTMEGIEWVTPLGIGLIAAQDRGLKFKKVNVNDRSVQLLALHEHTTVFDALLAAGHEAKQLVARPGQAVTYTVDGQFMSLPGKPGQPAELLVNGEPATLDTPLKEGAILKVKKAQPGEDAQLTLAMIRKPQAEAYCTINQVQVPLILTLFNQDQPVEEKQLIPDRAVLYWRSAQSLEALVPELDRRLHQQRQMTIKINGRERKLKESKVTILMDGQPLASSYHPRPGDRIVWQVEEEKKMVLAELVETLPQRHTITVTLNGEPKVIDTGGSKILINGQVPATPAIDLKDHDDVRIEHVPGRPPLLSHVLEGLTPPPQAGPIKIRVNGQAAGFTTPLEDGAKIEISFG